MESDLIGQSKSHRIWKDLHMMHKICLSQMGFTIKLDVTSQFERALMFAFDIVVLVLACYIVTYQS